MGRAAVSPPPPLSLLQSTSPVYVRPPSLWGSRSNRECRLSRIDLPCDQVTPLRRNYCQCCLPPLHFLSHSLTPCISSPPLTALCRRILPAPDLIFSSSLDPFLSFLVFSSSSSLFLPHISIPFLITSSLASLNSLTSPHTSSTALPTSPTSTFTSPTLPQTLSFSTILHLPIQLLFLIAYLCSFLAPLPLLIFLLLHLTPPFLRAPLHIFSSSCFSYLTYSLSQFLLHLL